MGKYVVYLSKSDARDVERRGAGGYVVKQLSSVGLSGNMHSAYLHVLDNLWWISHMVDGFKFVEEGGGHVMSTVFQGTYFENDVEVIIKD